MCLLAAYKILNSPLSELEEIINVYIFSVYVGGSVVLSLAWPPARAPS